MTESEFISQINGELTASGSLPTVVEEPELKRIIKQASMWFYQNWIQAVEPQHYVITKGEFNNSQFKQTRTIQMPDCTVTVYEVREINGVGRLGNIDRDFAEDRLIASEIFISSFHGDDLVMRTAQYQYFDLAKAFFLEDISFDFNENTKKISIQGRDPKYDVFIKSFGKIPLSKLYDDIYFLRWCTAEAKKSFGRIVSIYPFPLPGGVTINGDILKTEGEEEIQQLKEQMDAEQPCDWFLMYHISPLSLIIISFMWFKYFIPSINMNILEIGFISYILFYIYNINKKVINTIWINLNNKLKKLKTKKILQRLLLK